MPSNPSYMHSLTFPKSERLLKNREFLRVYQGGKKEAGRYLILGYLLGQNERKIGIRVSSRVGKAVIRNRIKRLFREAYRLNKHKLGNCVHLVLTAKPEIVGKDFSEVESDLLEVFKQAKLI